jgi:PAS domain-containing protein
MQIHSPDIHPTRNAITELDRLGDAIAELSAHLEAATARLLDLIRDFDARGGWNTGFRSCAAWLSWRVGLDLGAARERVRVARALGTLPALAEALARGELSYAKVRALTRVATPETEGRLRNPDGVLQFRRPDGRLLPEVPPPDAVPADPVQALRVAHDAQGLRLHARTACPSWLGERFDAGWAIDVLHPLATHEAFARGVQVEGVSLP